MSTPNKYALVPATNTKLLKGSPFEKCQCAECTGKAIKTTYVRDEHGTLHRIRAEAR